MNDSPADDDWRGYWLGRLGDDEAARLDCRLLADDGAREALDEALTDLHDDYAREQLTVAEHAAFRERVLLVSAEARARQRFAQAMKPLPETLRRAPRSVPARYGRRPSWTLLAGALIAAALALTLSLNRHWLAPSPAAGGSGAAAVVRDAAAPTALLLAPSPSAQAAPVRLALDPRAVELRVQAEIVHAEEARLYRLRVLSPGAAEDAPPLFEAADLPLQTLGGWRFVDVRLPASLLLGQTRIVRIDAQPPAGPFRADWTVIAPENTAPAIALPAP